MTARFFRYCRPPLIFLLLLQSIGCQESKTPTDDSKPLIIKKKVKITTVDKRHRYKELPLLPTPTRFASPVKSVAGGFDPFVPLVDLDPQPQLSTGQDETSARLPTSEGPATLDLSRCRIAAIVQTQGDYLALLEEASGKGYILKSGDRLRGGEIRVTEINDLGIVVEKLSKGAGGEDLLQKEFMKVQPDSDG